MIRQGEQDKKRQYNAIEYKRRQETTIQYNTL